MKSIKRRLRIVHHSLPQLERKKRDKYVRSIAYWIGCFVIEFNNVEAFLTEILAHHISYSNLSHGYLFLSGMQFATKLDLLEKYYRFLISRWYGGIPDQIKFREHMNEVQSVFTALRELSNTRNAIVHSDYHSLEEDGTIVNQIKYDKGIMAVNLVYITKPFLIESIDKAKESLLALRQLEGFMSRRVRPMH